MRVGFVVLALAGIATAGLAAPRPAPAVIASGRHEPKHLVADATGATWVELTGEDASTTSTVWHVAKGGMPKKLATVRGTITALGLGGSGALYAGLARGESYSIVRLRGGKAEPFFKADGVVAQLAVDDGAVYWGGGGGAFERIDRKTHAMKELASSVEYSYVDHMAIDGAYLYWSNELDDTPRRIYRVPVKGGDVDQVDLHDIHVWTVAEKGPVLVTDEVAEAAYAGAITWGLTDAAIVVLAP